jgi:two-component system, NarL family, response regulator DesR
MMGIVSWKFAIEYKLFNVQITHTIFIADHNQELLDGLTNIIRQEPVFRVVGTAMSVNELMDNAACRAPEIFLVDSDLPGLNDLHIAQYFLSRKYLAKMIMLTDHWENSLIKRLIAMGVMGCLLKTCDADELILAIHQVLAGKTYYPGFSDDHLKMFQRDNKINNQK